MIESNLIQLEQIKIWKTITISIGFNIKLYATIIVDELLYVPALLFGKFFTTRWIRIYKSLSWESIKIC